MCWSTTRALSRSVRWRRCYWRIMKRRCRSTSGLRSTRRWPSCRRCGSGDPGASSISLPSAVRSARPTCCPTTPASSRRSGSRRDCAQLAKDGVLVTTVCPGLMRTGSHVNATFKGQHRTEYTLFSLIAAMPVLSMNAEKAARQIVTACKRGDAEVVLTLPAQVGAAVHGLFPGLTADLLGVVNRLLPGPGGIGTGHAKGKDSQTALSPSWLTAHIDAAAQSNNELIRPGEADASRHSA